MHEAEKNIRDRLPKDAYSKCHGAPSHKPDDDEVAWWYETTTDPGTPDAMGSKADLPSQSETRPPESQQRAASLNLARSEATAGGGLAN